MPLTEDRSKVENNQSELSEAKKYFISDEKFDLLKQYQQSIFKSTEVSPALRKIVNELITIENLEKVKEKFLCILSHV